MKRSAACRDAGFTLIEVILTISILAFGLLAVASMQVSAIRANGHADRVTEATILAQDKMEELMADSYANVTSGSEQEGAYTVTWSVTENTTGVTSNTKIVTVTISGGELDKEVAFTCVKSNI